MPDAATALARIEPVAAPLAVIITSTNVHTSPLRPYETANQTSAKVLLFAELTVAFLPGDGCMADNQNGIFHRSNHKRASYPRFVLVSKTECGDWLIIVVANPELGKAAFGWVHFHWCKSISHLRPFPQKCHPTPII